MLLAPFAFQKHTSECIKLYIFNRQIKYFWGEGTAPFQSPPLLGRAIPHLRPHPLSAFHASILCWERGPVIMFCSFCKGPRICSYATVGAGGARAQYRRWIVGSWQQLGKGLNSPSIETVATCHGIVTRVLNVMRCVRMRRKMTGTTRVSALCVWTHIQASPTPCSPTRRSAVQHCVEYSARHPRQRPVNSPKMKSSRRRVESIQLSFVRSADDRLRPLSNYVR